MYFVDNERDYIHHIAYTQNFNMEEQHSEKIPVQHNSVSSINTEGEEYSQIIPVGQTSASSKLDYKQTITIQSTAKKEHRFTLSRICDSYLKAIKRVHFDQHGVPWEEDQSITVEPEDLEPAVKMLQLEGREELSESHPELEHLINTREKLTLTEVFFTDLDADGWTIPDHLPSISYQQDMRTKTPTPECQTSSNGNSEPSNVSHQEKKQDNAGQESAGSDEGNPFEVQRKGTGSNTERQMSSKEKSKPSNVSHDGKKPDCEKQESSNEGSNERTPSEVRRKGTGSSTKRQMSSKKNSEPLKVSRHAKTPDCEEQESSHEGSDTGTIPYKLTPPKVRHKGTGSSTEHQISSKGNSKLSTVSNSGKEPDSEEGKTSQKQS